MVMRSLGSNLVIYVYKSINSGDNLTYLANKSQYFYGFSKNILYHPAWGFEFKNGYLDVINIKAQTASENISALVALYF
jgi:hypothetical protein